MGEHDGHRLRIMEKLDTTPLHDHELLEIALFSALPRKNTNDLAHRLLAEFGSLQEVFNAPFNRLRQVSGVGDSVAGHICMLGKLLPRLYGGTQKSYFPEIFDRDTFIPYVKEEYKILTKEVLDIYLLNAEGVIIQRKRFGMTNRFKAEMAPEELTKLLVDFSPAGIVLVHNHPYGEAVVSETDEYMTRHVQLICSTQNVLLCDHVVYASNGVYSYYLSGKLQKMAEELSVKGMLGSKPYEERFL